MTEEMELIYEKLEYAFHNRRFADLRMTLLDMAPFDIANYMEENLDGKDQIV